MINRIIVRHVLSFLIFFVCFTFYGELCYGQQDTLRSIIIRKITIKGNKHTKDYIIARELDIREGDSIPFYQISRKLRKGREQIYNTTLFVQVSVDSAYESANVLDLLVSVKEKWHIYPLPEFQIVDRSYNEWIQKYHGSLSRVNYGVKFVDNNLTGRKDQLRITLLDGYSREVGFNYNAPYANPKLTNGFFIGGNYAQTREIAYKSSYNNQLLYFKNKDFVRNSATIQTGYSIRKAIKTTHSFSIRYTFINLNDSIVSSTYNPHYINSAVARKGFGDLFYNLQIVDVNNILYPLQGYTLSFGIQKRGLEFSGGTNLVSVHGEYNVYRDLGKKWYAGFQAQGMIKLPFDQPYINQQALGYGSAYIRGLESYVIDGVADVISKINIKREILNLNITTPFKRSKTFNTIPFRVYAKVYTDVGYAYAQPEFSTMLNNRFLHSSGIGVDIVTFYDLQVRFEYSFNQLGQKRLFLHNEKGF